MVECKNATQQTERQWERRRRKRWWRWRWEWWCECCLNDVIDKRHWISHSGRETRILTIIFLVFNRKERAEKNSSEMSKQKSCFEIEKKALLTGQLYKICTLSTMKEKGLFCSKERKLKGRRSREREDTRKYLKAGNVCHFVSIWHRGWHHHSSEREKETNLRKKERVQSDHRK